eukprot:159916-Pyramimonas_sp.AAC.1
MKLSCDQTNAPANSAGSLSCSTFQRASQRSFQMSVRHSVPALCMELSLIHISEPTRPEPI